MAGEAERAERIRDLKDARPDLTWRRIADACGVSERSALEWRKKGNPNYEHCKLLAGVFEVDADWLWRGKHQTPDLMGALSVADRLGRLEGKVDELLAMVAERELKRDDPPEDPPAAETA